MRLICTITSAETEENPYQFSAYLKQHGIENECEEVSLPNEEPFYRIWVTDEDKVEKALQYYHDYKKDPSHSKFQIKPEKVVEEEKVETQRIRKSYFLSPVPYGKITILIIAACILIFIAASFRRESMVPPKIEGIVEAPMFSEIDTALLYDYPLYFEERDELLKIYTPKDIKEKIPPSAKAESLIEKIRETPFWNGIYERVINYFNKGESLSYKGPMFEKIQEGEIWRIFTPALVHFNLLHIFFNLLWFILLGNQIEFRIGPFRYILLIFFSAIVSNTAQYLMSGSFFMGLSGVVVGLVGFVWARQQKAPWEGYLLNRVTLIFLGAFVFGMFALQLIFFLIQIFGKVNINIAIANTAHIAGGIVGYILGRMKYFSLRHRH